MRPSPEWLAGLVAAIAVSGACGQSAGSDDPLSEGSPQVSYNLAWERDEVLEHEGGGWETTTNLGYEVRVERAYVVSYSLQLVPCRDQGSSAAGALLRRFAQALDPVRSAWAGHGDDDDVSTVLGVVEPLHDLGSRSVREAPLGDTPYCQIHYLVARADHYVSQRPLDVDIERLSIHLSGTWKHAEDDLETAFRVEDSAAFGVLVDLVDLGLDRFDADTNLELTLTRSSATLFDDIDFADGENVTEGDIARAVVRAMVEGAVFEARLIE